MTLKDIVKSYVYAFLPNAQKENLLIKITLHLRTINAS